MTDIIFYNDLKFGKMIDYYIFLDSFIDYCLCFFRKFFNRKEQLNYRNRTQELHTIQLLLHLLRSNHHDNISRTDAPNVVLFLVFTHMMRRPCWCTEQWQNVAQVLHNNRTKFPKEFFRYCSGHQHGRRGVTWKSRILLQHFQFRLPRSSFIVVILGKDRIWLWGWF